MSGLGRLHPNDWDHLDKYPLSALESVEGEDLRPKDVPVTLGINWYSGFDHPIAGPGGRWYLPKPGNLGSIRGGHCICAEPGDPTEQDPKKAWWDFYNQGTTPKCVGFGWSRTMSLLNRHRYDAPWLYSEAQKRDGIPGAHEGSTVRAGAEVLRDIGHVRVVSGKDKPADGKEGISAFRWARTVDEVLFTLGTPNALFVPLLQSWGEEYPHRVYLPIETLDVLLGQAAEAAIITDR